MAIALQTAQSSVKQTLSRPRKYWPIVLIAALAAASAQAPLIGRFANPSTGSKSPIAIAADDRKANPQPRGVEDKKEIQPLAFEDKNRNLASPVNRKPDSLATPVVFNPPPIFPIEPTDRPTPATGFVAPPDIASGLASGAGDGSYTDPLPTGPPTFPPGDPTTGNDGGTVTSPVHNPILTDTGAPSTVPEPGSITIVLFAGTIAVRRRKRVGPDGDC